MASELTRKILLVNLEPIYLINLELIYLNTLRTGALIKPLA